MRYECAWFFSPHVCAMCVCDVCVERRWGVRAALPLRLRVPARAAPRCARPAAVCHRRRQREKKQKAAESAPSLSHHYPVTGGYPSNCSPPSFPAPSARLVASGMRGRRGGGVWLLAALLCALAHLSHTHAEESHEHALMIAIPLPVSLCTALHSFCRLPRASRGHCSCASPARLLTPRGWLLTAELLCSRV